MNKASSTQPTGFHSAFVVAACLAAACLVAACLVLAARGARWTKAATTVLRASEGPGSGTGGVIASDARGGHGLVTAAGRMCATTLLRAAAGGTASAIRIVARHHVHMLSSDSASFKRNCSLSRCHENPYRPPAHWHAPKLQLLVLGRASLVMNLALMMFTCLVLGCHSTCTKCICGRSSST